MKILWYNWRDIKNPSAGGAEIYTHEISRRLAKNGSDVTLFTSKFQGCKNKEKIDGVNIIRSGGKYSVYINARIYYDKVFYKEKYDVIIDEINTIPFFVPSFAKNGEKIFAIIHQLPREFWFYETPFPINRIGYSILENRWLEEYTDIPTITVSQSTKNDLEKLNFKKIYVIHNGVNPKLSEQKYKKSRTPTIVYVGRMKKAKKPQDIVKAFENICKEFENAQLWMIGEGYMKKRLEANADSKDITYFGYVENDLKNKFVGQAWVIAVPGIREGWGQVVTDANALGTPAVGYNIPGLRDSIKDGFNGLLVEKNPSALADGIIKILSNEELRKTMGYNSIEWAKQYNWNSSANAFLDILKS
jgi:glycosyltransferase involved in cell wall biosynthesis